MLRRADLLGKGPSNEKDLERLREFRGVVEREKSSAHRLRDLAIGGDDLIEIGYEPGPLSQRKEYNVDAFIRWYLKQMRAGGNAGNAVSTLSRVA